MKIMKQMKKIIGLSIVFFISVNSYAVERNLLEKAITKPELSQALAKGTEWVYFPKYQDRSVWQALDPAVKQELIRRGEKALNFEWGVIKATDFLEYTRSGNRDVMQNPDSRRTNAITDLALAELIEGKGRFIDQLVNGVWAMCEQSTWVLSAHLSLQKGSSGLPNPNDIVIDLGSGRTGALLAWVHYFFAEEFNKISPFIAEKIQIEVKKRILDPYYTRNDLWWMGFTGRFVNNWNVWVNYNVMQCILLMETDSQKRIDNIYKVMTSIDHFINYYPEDGGCDEGPSYWSHAGGKLYEGLELLSIATRGKVNIFGNELIKNIGRYIYRAYISDPYFVNFADASAKGDVDAGLVYRYGKAIGDPVMQGFGTFYAQKEDMLHKVPSGTMETVIHNLFDSKEIVEGKPVEPLVGTCWLPQSQFLVVRDKEGSKNGFFFAAKGGHNDESHNHNDVGTFILYYNGLPVLIDVGVGTYTRQTFSSARYQIWTMQSGYHNLPVINAVDQKNGRKFASKDVMFKSSAKKADFSLDIAEAYPPEAAVKTWERSYVLNKRKSFEITDHYVLNENKGGTSLRFMTSCRASIVKPGVIRLAGDGFSLDMIYNEKVITAEIESIPVEDNRLSRVWGNTVTRLHLNFNDTGLVGKNTVTIRK